MNRLALVVLVACSHAAAPPPAAPPAPGPEWAPLAPLVGTWEGTDPDTKTVGRFTLAADLGGKVLLRHNTDDGPNGHHEDLMIVFHAADGALRASYWDNEGHVIHYAITATPQRIELVSDEVAGAPRFRLVYDVKSHDELAIEFAIAMPGSTEFRHFAGGSVHRVR